MAKVAAAASHGGAHHLGVAEPLEEGDQVTVGNLTLDVYHCPGHTPGHVIFHHPASKLAIVGDVLFQGSVGRTDFPYGDGPALLRSIRDKLLPLGDDVAFICGHGPGSTIGAERRAGRAGVRIVDGVTTGASRAAAWAAFAFTWAAVYLGTVVTGTGPHGGDPDAPRHAFDPLLVNTAVGFIGPEYLYDGKQIIRAGLEDHFCGKLLGLPMGCDVCYTNHAEADPDDMDVLLLTLGAAGCSFVITVPGADDIMLNFQTTSFHDALGLRKLFDLRPAPEFARWLEDHGVSWTGEPTAISAAKRKELLSRASGLLEAPA